MMDSMNFERELMSAQSLAQQVSTLMDDAKKNQLAGLEAQRQQRWRTAVAHYEQAGVNYNQIATLARPHSQNAAASPLAMLRKLREETIQFEQQATQSLQAIQESTAHCQHQIQEAAEKLRLAHSASNERRCEDARDFAREAMQKDPELGAEAERLIRSLEEICTPSGLGRLGIVILIVLVLMIVLIIAGLSLWPRFQHYLYPPVPALSPQELTLAVQSFITG
jgi:hypothetical protein